MEKNTITTAIARLLPVVLVFALLHGPVASQSSSICIDAARSRFSIRVHSGGLFGVFGHDHEIEAQQMSGCTAADWSKPETASIDLIFPSAGIHVMDPDHPGDRPKVQATMENEVLRISDFPEIRFHSETVRLLSPGRLSVEGTLTIRGQARKVSIPLNFQPAAGGIRATGSYRLKQSDFGIEPVRVAAGTVRVKDEVDCDFELYLH